MIRRTRDELDPDEGLEGLDVDTPAAHIRVLVRNRTTVKRDVAPARRGERVERWMRGPPQLRPRAAHEEEDIPSQIRRA